MPYIYFKDYCDDCGEQDCTFGEGNLHPFEMEWGWDDLVMLAWLSPSVTTFISECQGYDWTRKGWRKQRAA